MLKLNFGNQVHTIRHVQGLEAANQCIELVLQLCPTLEEFEITRILEDDEEETGEDSFLRLDFSHLVHLKNIKVNIWGYYHYKFNVPRKADRKWRDLDTSIVVDSDNDDSEEMKYAFYIDLT